VAKLKKSSKNKKIKPKKPALHPETKKGIAVVVCFTLALLSFLSYFKAAGAFGQYFADISRIFFGRGFFLIPIGFILTGLAFLKSFHRPAYRSTLIGMTLFILSILGVFHIFGGEEVLNKRGGYFGFLIGWPLAKFLGFWASLVVLSALLLISILITFNMPLRRKKEEIEEIKKEEKKEEEIKEIREEIPLPEEKKPGLWEKFKNKANPKKEESEREEPRAEEAVKKDEYFEEGAAKLSKNQKAKAPAGLADFKLPPLDLLEKDKGQPTSGDIKANQNIIRRTLHNFGIEVEMAEVNIGPTITQYTLRPAQGVKLARITALHNDLALALAAHPLRIEAPIPSRALVGIEIPNKTTVLVRLRNLLEHPTFRELPSRLSFALGRSVAGRPFYGDLARMPHLLIAGATGAGKTIGINGLIISLLYQNSPSTLRLILIDPKRVEFTPYNNIPHLLTPVIVHPDKAVNALRWAISEMERRFDVLQERGTRDILAYNGRNHETLPYIVVVIDELADLMTSRGREVEAAVVRLAQMARAVGIHLVVSTQRPSVEVITGLIKANITSRIAFQVASQIDSRTILDMAGADKLLGHGDMLYLAGDAGKPRRIQGTYVSDKEIKKVADYLKKVQEPEYNQSILSASAGSEMSYGGSFASLETDDELYEEAKGVIIQAGKASASLLQRRLRIGYARAARLIDILEKNGVVGPAEGAKPREILTTEEERID